MTGKYACLAWCGSGASLQEKTSRSSVRVLPFLTHGPEYRTTDKHPFVKSPSDLNKDGLLRQNKKGQWVLQLLDKTSVPPIEAPSKEALHTGVDVGLNVMAATSDGRLRGQGVKPLFNRTYDKVKALRANRQRHGLKLNSPKLDYLELKLTEMLKNFAGQVSNELVRDYPGAVFVVEDSFPIHL